MEVKEMELSDAAGDYEFESELDARLEASLEVVSESMPIHETDMNVENASMERSSVEASGCIATEGETVFLNEPPQSEGNITHPEAGVIPSEVIELPSNVGVVPSNTQPRWV
ncbi:hypothetical protein GN244_ATG12308 [Phytophthora infestans]|uniref:Uncharacterized protein n=1 Tax=Phytophthora infestans TaxID=4787 RepID=A0A833SJV6_PHYIN|nr:hypothetical protein GN244_ATG12308 [Phytophthora infestans]KAF4134615.1 hypothetical protein GN958_ATG16162 [Phytophthora infestans]